MSESLWLWLSLAAMVVVLGWLFVVKFLPWWRGIRKYCKDCATCGYLPPPPTPRALRIMRWYAKLLLYLRVGRVTVIGRENANAPGPRIITPNHSGAADPAPFALMFDDEPVRYMATQGVFTSLGGLSALVAGPCGAFCVDLTPGKGGRAGVVAIKVLTTGQTLVMFPEGWAWLDGQMREFKKGAVKIARSAAQKLGRPVFIVPTYMRYGTYPGKWILSLPWMAQYLWLNLTSLLFYRHGLTIVFGKPISSVDLPEDDDAANQMLFDAVKAADPLCNPPPVEESELELQPSLLTMIAVGVPLAFAAAHAFAISFFASISAWATAVVGARWLRWIRRFRRKDRK